MIKIGQNNNLYVKSYTKDNFPYIEVFFDSSKKVNKGKLELRGISNHPTDKSKKILKFSQKVQIIYSNPTKTQGSYFPEEENACTDKSIQRLSTTVFNKIYSCSQEVPASITREMIEDKILSNRRACLYTVISNSPIKTPGPGSVKELSDTQISQQILRYHEEEEPNKKGDLFLDKYNKPQYRMTFLSFTGQPDIDLRSSQEKDYFIPEFLKVNTYGGRK